MVLIGCDLEPHLITFPSIVSKFDPRTVKLLTETRNSVELKWVVINSFVTTCSY